VHPSTACGRTRVNWRGSGRPPSEPACHIPNLATPFEGHSPQAALLQIQPVESSTSPSTRQATKLPHHHLATSPPHQSLRRRRPSRRRRSRPREGGGCDGDGDGDGGGDGDGNVARVCVDGRWCRGADDATPAAQLEPTSPCRRVRAMRCMYFKRTHFARQRVSESNPRVHSVSEVRGSKQTQTQTETQTQPGRRRCAAPLVMDGGVRRGSERACRMHAGYSAGGAHVYGDYGDYLSQTLKNGRQMTGERPRDWERVIESTKEARRHDERHPRTGATEGRSTFTRQAGRQAHGHIR